MPHVWNPLRSTFGRRLAFQGFSQREILTVPFRRPIKPVYIRKLVRFIDAVRDANAQT